MECTGLTVPADKLKPFATQYKQIAVKPLKTGKTIATQHKQIFVKTLTGKTIAIQYKQIAEKTLTGKTIALSLLSACCSVLMVARRFFQAVCDSVQDDSFVNLVGPPRRRS